jgi:cyanophycinase
MSSEAQRPGAHERRAGHLVIIGGNEDREEDKLVLRRFIELTGKPQPSIVVLTAASAGQDHKCEAYSQAFTDLGAAACNALELCSRDEANDVKAAERLLQADGIFITGGDQKRLLAVVGGTAVDRALRQAFLEQGKCIAGTSAGASALAQHMMHDGGPKSADGNGKALAAGFGLLERVVIDQHFSERQRLGRLLDVVALNPTLIGIGIDEDTALIVEPEQGIEVVGDGAITVLDGRRMSTNFLEAKEHDALELIDVKLHLLPAGARYSCHAPPDPRRRSSRSGDPRSVPPALHDIVSILTAHRRGFS